MMADNLLLNGVDGGDDGIIFVYTGGEQQVPHDVKRVRIAENVDTILARAFRDCQQLVEVEGHDRLRKVEHYAFFGCHRLRSVKMTSIKEIGYQAFSSCLALSDVDFDKLEIIRYRAFAYCESLRSINMPSIRMVGAGAFQRCGALTDAVFGKDLERIEAGTFFECTALRRIVIPLKDNLLIDCNAFSYCGNFSRVDALAGGIHETISSLHLENWRNEMEEELDRINQTLPNIRAAEKARTIQQWVARVLQRMEQYKTKHHALLTEATTLLELALWKTKLFNQTGDEKKCSVDVVTKNAKVDDEAARKEHRVTCGANIVIKNVLPFLALQ